MKGKSLLLSLTIGTIFFFISQGRCEEPDIYYARCNLRITKGDYISWANWQAAPTFLSAGTQLKVTKSGSKAILVNVETQSTYTLDIGADEDVFLEKFLTKKPVNIKNFPPDVQTNIGNAVARVGMTKEQVYIAMGPPAKIPRGKTNKMTYEDIMGADLWLYATQRFGKNMGVRFDPYTGLANMTEGI